METENQHSAEDIGSRGGSFDKKRRISGAILGPLCAIILWFLPIQGLSDPAHHLLAIMALVSIWWITEPVSIPVHRYLALHSVLCWVLCLWEKPLKTLPIQSYSCLWSVFSLQLP